MEYIDLIMLVIANTGDDYYCGFINEYWAKFINYLEHNNYNIKVFLVFGSENNFNKINISKKNIIYAENTHEYWIPGILQKTIIGLEHINNTYKYKHILRTNLSSFFILDNLIKINKTLSDINIYAGVTAVTFVSGAGFWLSKDIVEYILNNKEHLNYAQYDDVSIGVLLKHVEYIYLDRYDTPENVDVETIIPHLLNHYHIRIKSSNRNLDVMTMKKLTEHFYSS